MRKGSGLVAIAFLAAVTVSCSPGVARDRGPVDGSRATTATAAPTTTTTIPDLPLGFVDTPDGTILSVVPIDHLTSFRGVDDITLALGGQATATVHTEGVYVDGDLRCDLSFGFLVATTTRSVARVDGVTYFDDGTGFQEAEDADPRVVAVLGRCPAAREYWDGALGSPVQPFFPRSMDDIDGVRAQRVEVSGGASGGGFSIWIADPGGWVVAGEFRLGGSGGEIPPEFALFADPESDWHANASLRITDVDSPELAVRLERLQS